MSQIATESDSPGRILDFLIRIGHRSTSYVRQWVTIAGAIAFLVALGWVDLVTGPQVHLGLLYVVPVLVAGWFAGRWPGYVLGIAASLTWFKAGRPVTDGNGILLNVTNLCIRMAFYGFVVEVLVLLRSIGRRLEQSVELRTSELRKTVAEKEGAQESLRKLAGQLSAAEDAERRKVAYDIHDSLSQMLGVVKLNLETVTAETAIDTRQYDQLSDVVKVVDDLIRQTREMTFDLHPSMLDHFGLVPTLQRFAEDFQRRTLAEVTISEMGERSVLQSSLASYLFRAIKEVVNNAVKHGNAKEIIVAIHWDPQQMRTVIDDDGKGFDPVKALAPHARRGLGLAGIDERLTSLGGKLGVESQPGSGARVILEVPISGPASQNG